MPKALEFFVPAATPDNQESVYAEFARMCGVQTPPLDARVYSISFNHNGEAWVATVGETLRGERHKTSKTDKRMAGSPVTISDPAVVLAVFPGNPYKVVTNHHIVGNVGSAWENPFLAGKPISVAHFTNETGA